MTFYLNGKDLRAGFELGAATAAVSNDYFLLSHFKGLPDTDGDGIADVPAFFGTLRSRTVTQQSRRIRARAAR